jgi:peptidoglycan/xylan/chitin deacetylase (PgdA/CDA1 family)
MSIYPERTFFGQFVILQFMRSFALIVLLFLGLTSSHHIDEVSDRFVAFTFDDLPATQGYAPYVIQNITEKLTRHHVPAIGFVNESKLYTDGRVDKAKVSWLEQWLGSELDLGNHSYSHIGIDDVPLETYKADVLKGERITKQLLAERGKALTYYRHTQLRTGPTPEAKKDLDKFLKDHGYRIAPVTIDNNDFIFANVYEKARVKKDTAMMKYIGIEYLKYMEMVVKHFEQVSMDFLGYEVKQTLLLHANALNADYLDHLIQLFQKRGYVFISLDEALRDPAYQLEDAPSKKGLSWLHRWMLAKNLEMRPEPLEPQRINKLSKEYQ